MIIVVAPLTIAVLFIAITLFVLKRGSTRDRQKDSETNHR